MAKLIYVVDDEEPIRRLLDRALSGAGFEVLAFADGVHALRIVEITHPDLVLLDVRMPGFSGIDFLDSITRQKIHVPVFMLTSLFDSESIQSALDKGAETYLQKPFDLDYLVTYIKDYFASKIQRE